ncbi:hypothetical protein F5X98DRAFT_386293 [Xylaria grammica]|nr:hypothetical protein F5X98DRAFT_386293 [Xylaria grammica]
MRGAFDFVVFGCCIWFFADPSVLRIMLSCARNRAHRHLAVEYSLSASTFAGMPYVLAATTSNLIEAVGTERSDRNIRCVLALIQIVEAAKKAGWGLHKRETLIRELEQIKGRREVRRMIKSRDKLFWDFNKELCSIIAIDYAKR